MAAMMRGELLDDLIDALSAADEEYALQIALAEAEAVAAVDAASGSRRTGANK